LQARLTLGRKQLPAQEEGYHQSQWCCTHPKDQTFVEFLATWAHHPHQSYHHVQPIRRFRHVQPQSQDTITAKHYNTLSQYLPQSSHSHETTSWRRTPRRCHTGRHNWEELNPPDHGQKVNKIDSSTVTNKTLGKGQQQAESKKIKSYLITLRLGTLTIWMTVTISVIPW